jgi:hypothetical protein
MACGRVIQLEKGKPQNLIVAGTADTTTSRAVKADGHNAILIYCELAGTGTYSVKLNGASSFDGTYMDVYDHNGELMHTGNISTSRVQLFVGVPENFKVVATELVDGSTIKVDYELLTV